MTLSGNLDVERSSTLNMAGHPLSAATVYLGWNYAQPVTVLNVGPITASNLDVSASTLALSGSGNVIGSLSLYHASTLTLGGPLTLSGNLDVEQSSTLNMAGQSLTASTVYLGWNSNQPVTVLNGGPITATNLNVGTSTYVFTSSDAVTNLNLSTRHRGDDGRYGQRKSVGESRPQQHIDPGSAHDAYRKSQRNSKLDAEHGRPSADCATVELGYPYAQPVSVLNAGPITATNLYDYTSVLALTGSGAVTNLTLSYSARRRRPLQATLPER